MPLHTSPSPARRRRLAACLIAPVALASLAAAGLPAAAAAPPVPATAQAGAGAHTTTAASGTRGAAGSTGEKLFTEGFDSAKSMKKHGWAVENTDVAGMKKGWRGFGVHTLKQVVKAWGEDGNRGDFTRAKGGIAVVASDGNRPTAPTFTSVLASPKADIPSGAKALEASFDSHYRQGQAPQTARLVAVFDGEKKVVARHVTADQLDTRVTANVDVPRGAKSVQWRWEYRKSSNNWYWMIDNASVSTAAVEPKHIKVVSGTKPVAAPGERITLSLSGLREGGRVRAAFDSSASGAPATSTRAGADGKATVRVRVSRRADTGEHTLHLSGADVVAKDVSVTVFDRSVADPEASTEPVLAFEGFETGRVPASGRPWEFATLKQVEAEHGLQRRQAFTRGDGRVAHIDAAKAAARATLVTRSLSLPKDHDRLELRLDSHYLAGAKASEARVVLDYGTKGKQTVSPFDASASHESARVRIPLDVPKGARHLKVGLKFSAPKGGGNWSVDSLQLVRALGELPTGEKPSDVVDIISDIQGDEPNSVMKKTVLPGLRSLKAKASTLVANGDLVNSGDKEAYDKYFDALDSSGADYRHVISTIGNHEYYGSEGPGFYKRLWLRMSRMFDVGGQGGLWGEQVLPGGVPVLWIGSEGYDYRKHHGNGPFVKLSDQQFNWLRSRIEYYRRSGTPVLLFSHHPLPYTVSGTYAKFYGNDYGQDEARLKRLLADSPNVSFFTAHTHWDVRDPDWDSTLREDPTTAVGPSLFNTGSITTAFGPSGDWDDTAKETGNPVALRASVYKDRVRVTAYEFVDGKARQIKHHDVPRPTDSGR